MSTCIFVSNNQQPDEVKQDDLERRSYGNVMSVSHYINLSKTKSKPNLNFQFLSTDEETGEDNYLTGEEFNIYEDNIDDDDDAEELQAEDDFGFEDNDMVEKDLRGSDRLISTVNQNSTQQRKTKLEPDVLTGNYEEIFQAIKNDVGDMIPREYIVVEDANECQDNDDDKNLYRSRHLFDSILKSLVFKYLRRAYYFSKAKNISSINEESMKLALFNNYLGIKSSLDEIELARSLGTSASSTDSSFFREVSPISYNPIDNSHQDSQNELQSTYDPQDDYLRTRSSEYALLNDERNNINEQLCFLCRDDKTDLQIISSEYTEQRISSLRDVITKAIRRQGREIPKLFIKQNSSEFILLLDYLTYACIFLYTLSENEVTGNVMKGVTFSEYNIKLEYLYVNSLRQIIKRYSRTPQPTEIYNIISKLSMLNKKNRKQDKETINNILMQERKEGTVIEGNNKYPYEEDLDLNKIFLARYMTDRLYNILVALTIEYEQSNNLPSYLESSSTTQEPFDIFYVLSIEYGDYAKILYETLRSTLCDDSYLQLREHDQMPVPLNVSRSNINLINRITSCIFNMFLIELNDINIYSMYKDKLLKPQNEILVTETISDYYITGNKSIDTKPIFKFNSESKFNSFSDIITSTIPVYSFM
jgi:hypothetical protein